MRSPVRKGLTLAAKKKQIVAGKRPAIVAAPRRSSASLCSRQRSLFAASSKAAPAPQAPIARLIV